MKITWIAQAALIFWPALAAAQTNVFAPAAVGNEVQQSSNVASDASLPAVDGLNAKLSPFLTWHDSRAGFGLSGAVSVPLGHRFGLQIDGLATSLDVTEGSDTRVYSVGAHLFRRDPSHGLVGFYADYVRIDAFGGVGLYAGGLEGSLYRDRISLNGIVGVRGSDADDDDFVFAWAEAAYYLSDNIKTAIGYDHNYERDSIFVSGEWAFHSHDTNTQSLFAVASLGEGSELSIQSGLTFYFGNRNKSLIRRHREDDPLHYQSASLTTFNVYAILEYCEVTGDSASICP